MYYTFVLYTLYVLYVLYTLYDIYMGIVLSVVCIHIYPGALWDDPQGGGPLP